MATSDFSAANYGATTANSEVEETLDYQSALRQLSATDSQTATSSCHRYSYAASWPNDYFLT